MWPTQTFYKWKSLVSIQFDSDDQAISHLSTHLIKLFVHLRLLSNNNHTFENAYWWRICILKVMIIYIFWNYPEMKAQKVNPFQITWHESQFKLKVWFSYEQMKELIDFYLICDPTFTCLVQMYQEKFDPI